jgi:hypothetical protein
VAQGVHGIESARTPRGEKTGEQRHHDQQNRNPGNVAGSVGVTSNSNVRINRVNTNAPPIPIARPANANFSLDSPAYPKS